MFSNTCPIIDSVRMWTSSTGHAERKYFRTDSVDRVTLIAIRATSLGEVCNVGRFFFRLSGVGKAGYCE